VLAKNKLGRIGQSRTRAGLIYFASDASSLVTGTSLVIDVARTLAVCASHC